MMRARSTRRGGRTVFWLLGLLAAAGAAALWMLRTGASTRAGEAPSGGLAAIDVREVRRQGRALSAGERAQAFADVGSDDWTSEVQAERADELLAELVALAVDRNALASAPLDEWIAADFACQELRPAALETLRDAGGIAVRRAGSLAALDEARAAFRGAEGLRAALGALAAALGDGGDEARAEIASFGIETAERGFTTRSIYRAGRRAAQGARQQTADWVCRFVQAAGASDAPRLAWIGIERYEEVELALPGGRLYADCTAAAFADCPSYREQVLPGIDDWLQRVSRLANMSIGGHHGFAVGDVDGDGLEDLYVCDAGGLPNRLYVQKSDGTLRDATAESGAGWLDYSASCLLIDLDDDGDEDLALATRPFIVLMANDGSGRFEERMRTTGPLDPMSISAADFDLDGDLDLYACAYNRRPDGETPAAPLPYHDANNGDANRLYRNDGGFRFVDATQQVGLDQNNARYSFAAVWEDYDDDGDPDLYVANDFGRNNLYRNDGGSFVDVAASAGVEDIASGMSAAWGDADRDGRMDIYVANMHSGPGLRVTGQPRYAETRAGASSMHLRRMARGNTLYLNAGDGRFDEAGGELGVDRGGWAWGSIFTDFDGDGWEDLAVTNGYFSMPDRRDIESYFWRHVVSRSAVGSYTQAELDEYVAAWNASVHLVALGRSFAGWQRNAAFLSCGGTFADASFVSGLDFDDDGRAVAAVDWDRDGDLDLWLRNRTGPRARLMRNESAPNARGSIALRLRGESANQDGIGARVEVELDDPAAQRLVRGLYAGHGFLAQSSKWLHFGLGDAARVRGVKVRWPGGATESFAGVEPGGRYLLRQGSGAAERIESAPRPIALAPTPRPAPERAAAARSYLPTRMPLPLLRYARPDGGEALVEPAGKPLFVTLFASWWEPCAAELEELARGAARLRSAGIDVLALCVDGLGEPLGEAHRGAAPDASERLLERIEFPFATGRANPVLLDKLGLADELLFESNPPFAVPLGLLIDAHGGLAIVYRGRVGVERLLEDAKLLDVSDDEMERLAVPFAGDWLGDEGALDLPRLASWYMERYPEDAVRYLQRMSATPGARGAEAALPRILLAQSLRREGRLPESLAAYDEALAADPASLDALLGKGQALLSLERADDALAAFRRALELEPQRAEIHHQLGRAHQLAGSDAEAQRCYEAALAIRPTLSETRINLGNLVKGAGRIDEAIAHYRAGIAADPELPLLHYNLGEALREQQRLDEAVAAYARAVELDPRIYQAQLQLGATLLALARAEEAVPPLERAAELTRQRDLFVLNQLTLAYTAVGRKQDALATASRAYDSAVATGDQRAAQAIQSWLASQGGG